MTEADITAEREMCGWFNAQFDTLMGQINAFNADLAANQDNYAAPGIQHQADAVTANIDQSDLHSDLRWRRSSPGVAAAVQHQHQHQEPQPLGDQQHLHRDDEPLRQRSQRQWSVRRRLGAQYVGRVVHDTHDDLANPALVRWAHVGTRDRRAEGQVR